MPSRSHPSARERLLDAATRSVRRKGFAATSIDELCAAAGVTKGAFFHHFASKEALGVAAAEHWSATTGELFAQAGYHALPKARDRVLGYIDLREQLLDGQAAEYSCLAGTLLQEAHETSPAIRAAAAASMLNHAATLEADLAEALRDAGRSDHQAGELAIHIQAVLQGAFIVGKGTQDAAAGRRSVAHLKRYLEMLFEEEKRTCG